MEAADVTNRVVVALDAKTLRQVELWGTHAVMVNVKAAESDPRVTPATY